MKKLSLLTIFMLLLLIMTACIYTQPEGYAELYFYSTDDGWIAYVKPDGPIAQDFSYTRSEEKIYVYYIKDEINMVFKLAAKHKLQVYIREGNIWYVKATDIQYLKLGDEKE